MLFKRCFSFVCTHFLSHFRLLSFNLAPRLLAFLLPFCRFASHFFLSIYYCCGIYFLSFLRWSIQQVPWTKDLCTMLPLAEWKRNKIFLFARSFEKLFCFFLFVCSLILSSSLTVCLTLNDFLKNTIFHRKTGMLNEWEHRPATKPWMISILIPK